MTRDTTEQPAVRPGSGAKSPAKKPAGPPSVSPVPRPTSGGAHDVSTPPDGTPAVAPAAGAGTGTSKGAGAPPTVSPTPARKATSGARPAEKKPPVGPRRVRLAVSRVDPWSVMKLSFLLSIAIGIMIVVASVVFWLVLDGLHVFTDVNDMVVTILGEDTTQTDILQYVELQRFVSLSTIIAVVDVVLLTALSTIGAFLYNVVAALVGGVHLTLTDE
ncbi:DUF3566 domain-containing protein [Sanguibacter sp. 25GB23B1]|uniref:DUF3566 domain-containing protein n=1 Tax=unclassified Sanguibacter TaxID=2645534 RepID=UPI0032AF515A